MEGKARKMDHQMPIPDGELYTIKEVAALLRLSVRSVSDKIKAGIIPAVKIGRTLRIRRDAINQLLNDSTRGA